MEKNSKIKPKQYSHIDYEALLIYCMKKRISVEEAIENLGLNISRVTLGRNIRKMLDTSEIIDLYKNRYVPNRQKAKFPENLEYEISSLEDRPIVIKDSLEDLYNKLTFMKNIVESCGNNHAEAARIISSGNTILGNVKISRQGLEKNLKRYDDVKKEYEERNNKKVDEKGELHGE